MKRIFGFTTLWVLIMGLIIGAGSASAESWKFGVMSDTQWTVPTDPAGQNPNSVAVSIVKQIDHQFIKHDVKFVIQVGDLTENGNNADIAIRALAAQELYNAGIGFFPMRGNHETYANPPNNYGIDQFRISFPQTQ
ncbi:MAG: metallophosphoesterase, partial [Deltaproteobacteria bacterium]|nr:metallophosphoesterase [Deltaproteobacteria bacterium]